MLSDLPEAPGAPGPRMTPLRPLSDPPQTPSTLLPDTSQIQTTSLADLSSLLVRKFGTRLVQNGPKKTKIGPNWTSGHRFGHF